ncbi:MAG: xanthine dehydrogenase family protein molybdopterin-binding subunit [Pseudomonadota bacterium]
MSRSDCRVVGVDVPRVDAYDKVTGRTRYLDDMDFPGCLEAALVIGGVPHGALRGVDATAARGMPGVVAVLTGEDVPGENQVGCVRRDQPLLAVDRVRYVGDRVAIVAAETRDQARAAARAVRVDLEELPAVTDPVAALEDGAVAIHPGGNLAVHQKVRRGDPDAAFAAAPVVLERTFQVNYQEHAYMEPQAVAAVPGVDGSMTIYASLQGPHYIQGAVARVLGVPLSKVRVIQAPTGGAFGGKEDYPSEPAACAAVLAVHTGRPVRLVYDRAMDVLASTKRHRMRMEIGLAAETDGTLRGVRATLHVDAGGYLGLSSVVSERANCSLTGPYRVPSTLVDTLVVYTNNLFGGAFRGFGTPQTTFAMEAMMDLLAEETGVDRVTVRRRNLLAEGEPTITGQPIPPSYPAARTLDALLERSSFQAAVEAAEAFNKTSRWRRRGVGLATSMYGCCLHAGGQHLEGSGALVQVHQDGSINVTIGGAELGQGAYTMAAQIAAETLGAPADAVHVLPTDTARVSDSGPTVASRTTIMSGNAVRNAAAALAVEIASAADAAGLATDATFRERAAVAWRRKAHLSSSGWYAPPPKPWDIETGQGTAYAVYCFGAHVAEVEVNLLSGETRVLRMVAGHDVGRAIHPTMLKAQAEGGMVQGMGWALSEDLVLVDGRCPSPGLSDYAIPTTMDAPEMDVVLVEEPYPDGPFGAKGIGEPSLITAPAAVASAVRHALGRHLDRLPLTPQTLLEVLHDRREDSGGRTGSCRARRSPGGGPA